MLVIRCFIPFSLMFYLCNQSCKIYGDSFTPLIHILSCVIYTMCRRTCDQGLHKMRNIRGFKGSGLASDPSCRSILISNIHPSLDSRSSMFMDTHYNMPTTESIAWTNLRQSRFLRHEGRLRQPIFWIASLIP